MMYVIQVYAKDGKLDTGMCCTAGFPLVVEPIGLSCFLSTHVTK